MNQAARYSMLVFLIEAPVTQMVCFVLMYCTGPRQTRSQTALKMDGEEEIVTDPGSIGSHLSIPFRSQKGTPGAEFCVNENMSKI